MATRVACRCGQAFAAVSELAGTTVPCPVCGSPIAIPATAEELLKPLPSCARSQSNSSPLLVWVSVAVGGVLGVVVLAICTTALLGRGGKSQQASAPSGRVALYAANPFMSVWEKS